MPGNGEHAKVREQIEKHVKTYTGGGNLVKSERAGDSGLHLEYLDETSKTDWK